MKPRILIVEPDGYSARAGEILNSFADVTHGPMDRAALVAAAGDYDALVVRLGHRIDAALLGAAKRLKAVATATTGLNHIDLDAARVGNVTVLSLRGEREFLDGIYATAELSWGLVLSLMRHIPAAATHVRAGGWDRDLFRGKELAGKTLGVVGLGRLGTKVARYGLAFSMDVVACDTANVTPPDGVRMAALDEVLAQSDIVSLHVPYDDTTHGLMSRARFAAMKKGALLINTSRGEIVDEAALLDALESGHLAGAGLDVLCGENAGCADWCGGDALIAYAAKYENLLITPHIGGAAAEAMARTEDFIAEKLRRFFTAGA